MDTNELLRPLAEALGLTELTLDDQGTCALVLDDRLPVTLALDDASATLHLYCVLGPGPEDLLHQAACYAAMLDANLFGRGTGGATLAMDPDAGDMVLCRSLPLTQTTPESLLDAAELLIQAADSWHTRVQERFWERLDDDDAGDDPEPPAPETLMRV